MPIINRQDATEVEVHIKRIFDAQTSNDRAHATRGLFTQILDFEMTFDFSVGLEGAANGVELPASAELVAQLDNVRVAYVDMSQADTDKERVLKAETQEAARLISSDLGQDLLMVFTNRSLSQLHFVLPSFSGRTISLRRMIIERHLPRRTAVQQLSNIYWEWKSEGDIRAALESAFDVEKVTRDFFNEYKKVFNGAMEKITGFEDDNGAKNLFVQTLFNRLMFIYFISRKGWLEFDGDQEYLNAVWNDYDEKHIHNNFYKSRLSPLFFEGLNNPFNRNVTSIDPKLRALIGQVPFLNGGLFEKAVHDEQDGVMVPDDAVRPILTQLFDRFNFTVMESTPLDVEVAVDPEMLGKVFEELVTGRHESGSYYTPRPVVSFMCREALKGYLNARVGAANKTTIARFVDEHSTKGIKINAARQIAAALESIKVVDPACGSGAYLLGMMQELIDLQTTLFRAGVNSKELYDLKLQIIRDNLYGVDIDRFAVNIAMLRLWLSLAIDYNGPWPEPLPNLEFKVIRGDSLRGQDPTPETVGGLANIWVKDLRIVELKAKYMQCHDPDEKNELKSEIRAAENEIRRRLGDTYQPGIVEWPINFAEVFPIAGGFDVVVANPPYVRQEKIGETKAELRKIYKDSTVARSDLYCYFYVRALQLLRNGGVQVFVCSNSWLDVGYGAKLQQYLLKNARVDTVYESAVERQFSTAQINTIISVISRSDAGDDHPIRFVSLRDEFESAIADETKRRETLVGTADLLKASYASSSGKGVPKFVGEKWGAKYLRAPDIYRTVMKKGEGKMVRLGDLADVKRGITTGANEFFYLTRDEIASWGIEDKYLKPVMTSPQESRSITVDLSEMSRKLFVCDAGKNDLSGTAALDYIEWGEAIGYCERPSVKNRKRWYSLGSTTLSHIATNKMIDVTSRTFLVCEGSYFNNVFYTIDTSAKQRINFCISLNSSVMQLILNAEGRVNFGGGMLEIASYELDNLLIIDPSRLITVEPKVFKTEDWNVLKSSPERRLIDDAVFDVLELTQGERDGVYEGVRELVENRIRRARSV